MEVRIVPLPGYVGYFVGDDGSVWTTRLTGGNTRTADRAGGPLRQLKPQPDHRGYLKVGVSRAGKRRIRFVHHLVLEAFVGPMPDGMEGCHYPDADPLNNRLENLRWDTRPENARDKYRDRPSATEKPCSVCQEVKPLAQFPTDQENVDGRKNRCRKCHYIASYAGLNKDRKRDRDREYMRRWRATKRAAKARQEVQPGDPGVWA